MCYFRIQTLGRSYFFSKNFKMCYTSRVIVRSIDGAGIPSGVRTFVFYICIAACYIAVVHTGINGHPRVNR